MPKKREKPENPQKNMIKFLTIFYKNRHQKVPRKMPSNFAKNAIFAIFALGKARYSVFGPILEGVW
jgi:hypothetical protein